MAPGSYLVRTVTVLPLARNRSATGAARACGLVALAALAAGCGGVTGGRVALGYPTANPVVKRASTLQTRLNGRVVRFVVPAGWGLARLDTDPHARPAFVRLDGDCYLAVSITGSSTRALSAAGIASLYSPAGGYTWTITHIGPTILALLGEQNTTTGKLSRSSLGTVYLPTNAGAYLAIDFGAGVWPLDGHACPGGDVAARLPMLTSASEAIFGGARLAGADQTAVPGGASASTVAAGTASAPLTVTATAVPRDVGGAAAAEAARIDRPASA